MNKAIYFLSTVLLLLSCYPCSGEDCRDDGDKGIAAFTIDEKKPFEESSACSPFCIDRCCSVHAICSAVYKVIILKFDQEPAALKHFPAGFPSTLLSSVWQPPKSC